MPSRLSISKSRQLVLVLLVLTLPVLAAPVSAQTADGSATVASVAVTSSPASGDVYAAGEKIQVTATFSEAVTVTGAPYLRLRVGGGDDDASVRNAAYASGSGSTAIVFEYTVAARDRDANGISILLNAIVTPTGATIQGAGGTNANPDYQALPNDPDHKVEGFGVTNVAITSSPKSGDTYGAGAKIQVTATFSEAVTVSGGDPFLRLEVGDLIQPADYVRGSGSAAIVFEYTVAASDRDTDGVSIPENPIIRADKDGAPVTIQATDGTDANTNYSAVSDQAGHKVDGSADAAGPTITEVRVWSFGDPDDVAYNLGDVIDVRVAFNEKIVVTGTPTLDVTIGTNTRTFSYSSAFDYPNSAIFEYTVQGGDSDNDGISIPANSLKVPTGASIEDEAGNAAVLTHDALSAQADHKVSTAGGM